MPPRPGRTQRPLSATAVAWRMAMWLSTSVVAVGFVVAILAARGTLSRNAGLLGACAALAGAILVLLCGMQGRKQALDDRLHATESTLLVALAAGLKDQDEATLRRMAQQHDDAGKAARLVLQGRAERTARSPSPPVPPT